MFKLSAVIAIIGLTVTVQAKADSTFTSRLSNGYTSTTKCSKSFYNGTTCSTTSAGDILAVRNDRPTAVIKENGNRAGSDWAAMCRTSCYDASGE